jgi:hypothetical protein
MFGFNSSLRWVDPYGKNELVIYITLNLSIIRGRTRLEFSQRIVKLDMERANL